ncbi:MAG: exoribonuclease II [Deltaproteobacteria bacterium]|nr:MAG: exoribonuclease II [Deltaproteobacteria bacterium]
MNEGQIVEYIDDQKILCAVILEIKKNRLRLLNENNREINLAEKRISFASDKKISLKNSRDQIAKNLKKISLLNEETAASVDICELWEVLNTESDWVDLDIAAELNFGEIPEPHQKSGVMRAMFYDRLYFKFNHDKYLPFTPDQVKQLIRQKEEDKKKKKIIEYGGLWLRENISAAAPVMPDNEFPIIKIISSYYLHENESPYFEIAKAIFKEAGIEPGLKLFKLFTRLSIWDIDENTELLKYEIEDNFSKKIKEEVSILIENPAKIDFSDRKDFTCVNTFTIDGKQTRDFDDALSFEIKNGKKIAGVHITDVGFFIKKDTPLDRNAMSRSSSIYMPEKKIPMLHPHISENIASLIKDNLRPAISIMMELDDNFIVKNYEIFPSVIKVTNQISYDYADELINENKSEELKSLYFAAKKLREKRFESGAVYISIPDVDVYVDENKKIEIKISERETPAWILVSEFMIMANNFMADFLTKNNLPALFRCQAKPETRHYDRDQGSLHQQLMQRKEMSRVIISTRPEPHCGLGLNQYITATSPVRKYSDLVCQRQIKSVFNLETPYSEKELNEIINTIESSTANIGRVQFSRKRYWMLKFLESKKGEKQPALVINEKRSNYSIILLNLMLECRLAKSSGMNLKPGDNIMVTLQNINSRSDILSVHLS